MKDEDLMECVFVREKRRILEVFYTERCVMELAQRVQNTVFKPICLAGEGDLPVHCDEARKWPRTAASYLRITLVGVMTRHGAWGDCLGQRCWPAMISPTGQSDGIAMGREMGVSCWRWSTFPM